MLRLATSVREWRVFGRAAWLPRTPGKQREQGNFREWENEIETENNVKYRKNK